MKFKAIDYNLSPYTGLTRESWIEAGAYLLSGIFQDVESVQNPIVVKRTETEITYRKYMLFRQISYRTLW